jgi:hypothetical protein
MAVGPVMDWEDLVERTDTDHSITSDASTHFFQKTVSGRMERKAFPDAGGSLRRLINNEFQRSVFGPQLPILEGYRFLRLLPHRDLPADTKLDTVRVPTVVVAAVNDPFLSAQDLAELMATTNNAQVAGLMLRGGGHIGFAAYNRAYYFSLILNFFDSQTGAAAEMKLAPRETVLSADPPPGIQRLDR